MGLWSIQISFDDKTCLITEHWYFVVIYSNHLAWQFNLSLTSLFWLSFYPLHQLSIRCSFKFTPRCVPNLLFTYPPCLFQVWAAVSAKLNAFAISFHPISLWRDGVFGHTVQDLSWLSTWKLFMPSVQQYYILFYALAQVRALPQCLNHWTLAWLAYLLKSHQRSLCDKACFSGLRLLPLWEAKPLFGCTKVLNRLETEMEYCINVPF